jgi:Replication factor-A C terminal domain
MWGLIASNNHLDEGQIVAFKNMMLKSYNGNKCLNTVYDSIVDTNYNLSSPDVQLLLNLKNLNQTFASNKKSNDYRKGGSFFLSTILEDSERLDEFQPKKFYDFFGYITDIEEGGTIFYVSCPNDKCNRKVFEEDGSYRCESCSRSYENVINIYLFKFFFFFLKKNKSAN